MHNTILIIEDDAGLSQLITERVEEAGYTAASAASAEEALKWLSTGTPYFMLLDYTLPDMNAKEFISFLRKEKINPPPFIISTGQGDERIAVDMVKLGARDYIIKDSSYLDMLPEVIRRTEREIENEERRKAAESALRQSEENYRLLLDSVAEGIYGIDNNGNCTFCNNSCLKLLGYDSAEKLLGKNMHWLIHGKHSDGTHFPVEVCRIFKAFQSGAGTHADDEVIWRADGTSFSAEYWSYPQKIGDRVIGAVVTFLDITERKSAGERIKTLLSEKEILLKEVHHRIKNNMTTIKSLLFLQADSLGDTPAAAALRDAENRVESMMVLYDKLYRSSAFRELSMKEYLPALADEIMRSFPNRNSVTSDTDIADVMLGADTLFPLGIIINELLTNVMKYAFIGRDSGIITLKAMLNGNSVVVVVGDNGVTIPESVSFENTTGFGLDLVKMLTEQIGGKIRIERGNGTRFILEFKP